MFGERPTRHMKKSTFSQTSHAGFINFIPNSEAGHWHGEPWMGLMTPSLQSVAVKLWRRAQQSVSCTKKGSKMYKAWWKYNISVILFISLHRSSPLFIVFLSATLFFLSPVEWKLQETFKSHASQMSWFILHIFSFPLHSITFCVCVCFSLSIKRLFHLNQA